MSLENAANWQPPTTAAGAVTTSHPYIIQAVDSAASLLDRVISSSVGDNAYKPHPCFPRFLPSARALLFYKAYKVGCGLALEHGHGFVVARLGSGPDARWSAPCFVRIEGCEWGLVAGYDALEGLVGLLSDAVVQAFVRHSQRLVVGSESSWVWGKRCSDKEMLANADIAQVALARGAMLDISLKGFVVFVDSRKNKACYGSGVTPGQLMHGDVTSPPELSKLAARIRDASCICTAAAFDESVHDSEA